MSDILQEPDLLTETPDKQRGDYKRMIPADWLFVFVCVAGVFAASRFTNRMGVAGVIAICLGLLRTVRYGRVYYVIGQEVYNLWIRWAKRGHLWTKRKKKSLFARRPPIPLVTAGIGEIGLLYNVQDKTDTVVFVAAGGDALSRGLEHRFQIQLGLARLNEELAAMFPDYGIRLGYSLRKRPVIDVHMQDIYMENLHPDVVTANVDVTKDDEERLTPRERRALNIRRNTDELHELMMLNGREPLMVCTLTIRREKTLSKAFARGGSSIAEDRVRYLDVSKIRDKALTFFDANGISGARALSAPELLDYTRGAWDLMTIQDYHIRTAVEDFLDSVFGGDVSTGENREETAPVQWPQVAIDVYRDHMVVDGTYCAVIELTRGPNLAEPFYDDELYMPQGVEWPAITAVSESAKTSSDYLLVGAMINVSRVLTENLFSRPTAKMQLREQRQLEHEATLSTHRYFLSYKRFIAVAHTDWQQFVDQIDEVVALADRLGLGPDRVKGECRQLPAFLSATLALPMF